MIGISLDSAESAVAKIFNVDNLETSYLNNEGYSMQVTNSMESERQALHIDSISFPEHDLHSGGLSCEVFYLF